MELKRVVGCSSSGHRIHSIFFFFSLESYLLKHTNDETKQIWFFSAFFNSFCLTEIFRIEFLSFLCLKKSRSSSSSSSSAPSWSPFVNFFIHSFTAWLALGWWFDLILAPMIWEILLFRFAWAFVSVSQFSLFSFVRLLLSLPCFAKDLIISCGDTFNWLWTVPLSTSNRILSPVIMVVDGQDRIEGEEEYRDRLLFYCWNPFSSSSASCRPVLVCPRVTIIFMFFLQISLPFQCDSFVLFSLCTRPSFHCILFFFFISRWWGNNVHSLFVFMNQKVTFLFINPPASWLPVTLWVTWDFESFSW